MKKIVLFILLGPLLTFAQEMDQYVIASQGDFSESAEMSLSWTIGELLTETALLEDVAFTQGFQQPFLERKNVLRPEQVQEQEQIVLQNERDVMSKGIGSNEVNVFPNPSDGLYNVEILSEDDLYFLEVLDASGKVVYQTQGSESLNVLDLSAYENGLYILRVSNSELTMSSIFRLVKI